jgi:uncharacterized membrane protein
MIKNFFEMPRWLKLLTIAGLAVVILALSKPFSGVGVFGEQISPSTWWGSGAGLAFTLPALIMGYSAILFLRRSQKGRIAHVVGWITMTLGAYIGVHLEHLNPVMLNQGIAFNMAITVGVVLYLYLSKAVKLYFLGSAQ